MCWPKCYCPAFPRSSHVGADVIACNAVCIALSLRVTDVKTIALPCSRERTSTVRPFCTVPFGLSAPIFGVALVSIMGNMAPFVYGMMWTN